LKEDAKNFCSREEAIEVVNSIERSVSGDLFPADIMELYDLKITKENYDPPNPRAIGRWLEQNKEDRSYFAEPEHEEEEYTTRVPRNPLSIGLALGVGADDYVLRRNTRTVISGYSWTTEAPFKYLKVRLEPRMPNVTPEECYIAPIISRTHIRLFWGFSHFEYTDWDKARPIGKVEWITADSALRDKERVNNLVKSALEKFVAFVEEPLVAKWGANPAAPLDEQKGAAKSRKQD
jgi:hypothetical protein